jgi:hypothetical protein
MLQAIKQGRSFLIEQFFGHCRHELASSKAVQPVADVLLDIFPMSYSLTSSSSASFLMYHPGLLLIASCILSTSSMLWALLRHLCYFLLMSNSSSCPSF